MLETQFFAYAQMRKLRPVLRARDFAAFDLERAFRIVKNVAAIIG